MQLGCRRWKANGSQPWLSPVLREQDDRGIETRLLWSWVSKRDEGGMEVGLFMGLRECGSEVRFWSEVCGSD